MTREIAYSVGLHLAVLAVAMITSPLQSKQQQFGEVIKVSLMAAPPAAQIEPEPLPPLEIPKAVEAESFEVPLDDPAAAPEAPIEEPKEEPPPEKKPEKDKGYQPKADPGESDKAGDAEGTSEVEAAGGSPFAGATIDNASFDYPYWFTQAFYKIQVNWKNPVAADYEIICLIYFQVIKSGRIIELRVEQSSGVQAYDDACMRAVSRSAPFPPLPRGFPDEIIGLTLPFKYEP